MESGRFAFDFEFALPQLLNTVIMENYVRCSRTTFDSMRIHVWPMRRETTDSLFFIGRGIATVVGKIDCNIREMNVRCISHDGMRE